ncbi:hypothetical protein [Lysinibacillus sp. Bpr_S20]|uniref:hypothetical protein n=1 Tax=Lysinibacillus sp. Bpr_S20 TaxID=2933964 RepID=UPI0020114515|nr:hypothetical protein [Lysinibacillus sp. Bpr_S20]MCL1700780.1 hypothetical protein [Lysinibacillus sp. Bpr_S20]
MRTFGELVSEIEKLENRNKEISKRIELLSLDDSLESRRKRNQLLSNENKSILVNQVVDQVKREMVDKVQNRISVSKEKVTEINHGFTLNEELQIKIILWMMSKFDNEYIQSRLENKLISYRKGW